jgi:N-acyl-D-aspartate/D-glutamate deacylase
MFDLLIKRGRVVDGTGKAGFVADVAVQGQTIAAVGKVEGQAKRVIDADGLIVTPGWIDIHTHYDGQATWDPVLDPSFSSGVTTAFLGNCGVGFAPVRPGTEERLIKLMEGVEEIPGEVLREGLPWTWRSFPDYLDALAGLPRSFDIGALLPHGTLRFFVLGGRAGTDKCATGDDLAALTGLADEAMRAGAFGMSTSRTRAHRTLAGEMTPDYNVAKSELLALARAVASHGGIVECSPAENIAGGSVDILNNEMQLYDELVRESGAALHFITVQLPHVPDYWRRQIEWAERVTKAGQGEAFALVSGRPIGLYLAFFGMHPFMDCPTFKRIEATLPRDQWLKELGKPEVRAAILAEPNAPHTLGEDLSKGWETVYMVGTDSPAEPTEERKLIHEATRQRRPVAELGYDLMVQSIEAPRLVMLAANYCTGSLDPLREMLTMPGSLLSLSDAGAHLMSICDGTLHTFMLIHWARDRSRGPKLALEDVVRKMTSDCARAFRLKDRGVIAPGYKADLNVIDLERLNLQPPAYVRDLPAGGTRLLQKVNGYRATVVSGVVTRENDAATGARPGCLVRANRIRPAHAS